MTKLSYLIAGAALATLAAGPAIAQNSKAGGATGKVGYFEGNSWVGVPNMVIAHLGSSGWVNKRYFRQLDIQKVIFLDR